MVDTFHTNTGAGKHIVGIGDLRVIVTEENGRWFAQGLEIDYGVQGESLEDVKERFQRGLIATIHEHIRCFRTIDRLLTAAPRDVWHEFMLGVAVKRMSFSCVSVHEVAEVQKALPDDIEFPFAQISFLKESLQAAA